ncbi:MAG: BamA/TamA family outer membrane protein [Novosphingobium sp.]
MTTAMVGLCCCAPAWGQPASPETGPTPVAVPLPAPDDSQLIDQKEFDAAVPPLDPELSQPLETLDDFDRAMSAAEAPAKPAAPTAATPAVIPVDVRAVDAPELAKPLEPLSTVDTRLADVADTTEPVSDELRYAYQFEGLDGLDLKKRLESLSDLREGKGKAANATVVAAWAREDAKLAVRLLKSEGYQDVTANTAIEPATGKQGVMQVAITIAPGPRYDIGAILVTGQPTVPPGLAMEALALKSGDPIIAARVLAAEARVSVRLPEQGYPFVKLGERDILLDPVTRTGDYTLPVDSGPRGSFGGFDLQGAGVFDARHIALLARFKPGELYDSRKVDDLRQALVATSLFREVGIEPKQTGTPGPDGTEQVQLQVVQTAGPPRSISASAGYNTGEGVKVQGTWTHRNLFQPEGAVTLAAVAGTQVQSLAATFRRSNAGQRDRSVILEAAGARTRYAAYRALTTTLAGRISYDSTPIWQKRITYAYGFELTGSRETPYALVGGQAQRRDYVIFALPAQVGFDASDNLLDPRKGYRALVRLSPETSWSGKVSPYIRTLFEASGYFPAGKSIVLAARARVGVIAGVSSATLAPSRRYYAGGGGSVRGFGYQELGPKDAAGNPIGGRSLNEFAVEARYRFGDFGIVPFIDAGQVYDSVVPKFSDLRFGAGIGGRYYTNFGPMRIDIATPLKRRKGESRVALYLSIGQAF